jgi:PAS domain S-box-containing protein
VKHTNNWSQIRKLVGTHQPKQDIFLTVINENGRILSANAKMIRTLHLSSPSEHQINFSDLLHPVNYESFRTALLSSESNGQASSELYLKNGYYHSMKWEIYFLAGSQPEKRFLCIGHQILDDNRVKHFNRLGKKNYQLIVEGLNAGVFFQDEDGELIAANQKAAEMFDATLERLYQLQNIGELWNKAWDIRDEKGSKVFFADTPFMRAMSTGLHQKQILLIKLKNGEVRWLEFSSQPLFDDDSANFNSVVSNIVDITEEKRLSAELVEQEALFNEFMKQSPNLGWVVDKDMNIVYGNPAWHRYFGLKQGEANNKKIYEVVPDLVKEALYKKHVAAIDSGKPTEFVEKVRWANGLNLVFHINLFPIRAADGRVLLGGTAVNLADKYEAEKKLKQANERLHLVSQATSDAIWEWDMQTGQIFRNDALMNMIGYNLEHPKGLSWWLRRIHPEDRNRISDKVKETTENNLQSWQDSYRFKCADGTYKYMQDRGYVVYENELPVKMIGSLQDVSGLKELEEQLMEEKLQRQNEISETIIKVQEKERTRIGHELHDNVNQILSTTKLYVDMMTPYSREEKQIKQKSLEYILMAIEVIRKLSKELVVPQLNQKGLTESIRVVIDDLHITTGLKIKFTHDLESELLSQGKKVTLFRIVQEQLKNIIKHSQATRVEIYLEYGDHQTRLIIKDNGIGFDPGQTRRGIGLSNIYERSRFYKGAVEVKTSPGTGCMLTITLPGD